MYQCRSHEETLVICYDIYCVFVDYNNKYKNKNKNKYKIKKQQIKIQK
jgi:hypothetical protein